MKPIVWLASLVLLAGCGMLQMKDQASVSHVPQSKYRFDYALTNQEPISCFGYLTMREALTSNSETPYPTD